MNRRMGAELVRIAGVEHVKVPFDHGKISAAAGNEDIIGIFHEVVGHIGVDLPFIPAQNDHSREPETIKLSGQKEAKVKLLREFVERLAPLEQGDHRHSEGGFQVDIQKSRHHGTHAGKIIDFRHYVISHQNPNSEEWREFVRGILVEKLAPPA